MSYAAIRYLKSVQSVYKLQKFTQPNKDMWISQINVVSKHLEKNTVICPDVKSLHIWV